MRAERFGSYSIETTVAGPSFLRLKSIRRYIRLWPPPRKRAQVTPWLFRPPFFLARMTSDFSGAFTFGLVQSAKSLTMPARRPADVGLYWRMPIILTLSFSRDAERS